MTLDSVVMAAASFLGAYLGQRHAAGKLVPELRAVAARVGNLERFARVARSRLARVQVRLAHLEPRRES